MSVEPPPRHLTVTGSGGVPIAVEVAGRADRPAIVFIHGIGQSALSWRWQLGSDLGRNYTLVAFDLRGHGASGKPWGKDAYHDSTVWAEDLKAVMAATEVKHPLVVAWSFGGFVINDYVRQFGTKDLAGIVYVSTLGGLAVEPWVQTPDPSRTAFYVNYQIKAKSADLSDQFDAAELLPQLLFAKTVPPQAIRDATLNSVMLPGYVKQELVARDQHHEDVLAKLDVPVLFVRGARDAGFNRERLLAVAGQVKHASVLVYEDSGHSPMIEEPERFNGDLLAFAKTVAP